MPPLHEDLVAEAIKTLESAESQREIAGGAAALTAGMGLERYAILDIRGGMGAVLNGLYHNAPAVLRDEASDLAIVARDPIVARARSSRVPFVWRAGEGGPWRVQNGDFGFRSGVAAPFREGDFSCSIVILSGADEHIEEENVMAVLAYTLMAASMLNHTFKRFAATIKPESPLTRRELDCLMYALVGRSSKETARALGIEPRTVNQYLERARSKLQVPNSYAAATTALHYGWLDLQQAMELAGLAPAGAGKISAAARK